MTCKYKVKIKDIQYNYKVQMTDIQSKYKFKVFCTGYDDSEIKDKIDAMYEAWPKASGEGETITLNDTANTTMAIDLKVNTSQEGTPQDIHVVSGDNSIVVCGKNLVFSKIANENISRNGLLLIDNSFDMHIARVTQGETYTISTNDATNGFVGGFFYDLPMHNMFTYDNQRVVQDNNKTFTAPITGYVAFRSQAGYEYAQLEKGTTASEFEPYKGASYPINLGDIELENGDSIQKIDNSWNIVRNNATIEPITDTTLIGQLEALKKAQSYSGQTNISQVNNDAPFTISATALMDLSNLGTSTVSTLNTASVNRLGTPVFNQSIDPINLEINSEDLDLNNKEKTIEETPEER